MVGNESFKAWFKQRRKSLDLTQEELAHLAGCSIYTVQRIEEGVLRPSRQLGELLAASLEIPPAERPTFVRWARTGTAPPDLTGGSAPSPAALSGKGAGEFGLPGASDGAINPYKGLRAFQEADAPDFFGRETLTQQLRARLAEDGALSRFLAVVGPSGSGKSSLVRAGLVPALRHERLPGGIPPLVTELIPGARPLEELEAALLRVATNPPARLLEQLRADERGLARAVQRVLPGDNHSELLLVIDQFEELFTLVSDAAARQDFIDSLFSALTDPRSRLRVVITLRADFYDRPLLYLPASELLGRRTEVVGPLTVEEMYRAITGPAERAGLEFESSLVATIIQDMGEQPGTLPLLQYTLSELCERRAGRLLTLAAYRASGGLFGSLAQRAESLYAALPAQEQAAAQQLFLRLVTLGEGGEDTRRRVSMSELVAAVGAGGGAREAALHRVLDVFGRYRMLTFDRNPITREPTVEVAHEALLGAWERLRAWLEASREALLVQRRLMALAAEWQAAGQEDSFLATGARLVQFANLAAEAGDSQALTLTGEEQAYIAASLEEQQHQQQAAAERQAREVTLQKRAAHRLRVLAAALALFLLVASALALLAVGQQREAQTNLTRSEALRLAAEANSLLQSSGPAELIALLSLRSIRTQHSPQGDTVLEAAARLDYPVRHLIGYTDTVAVLAFSPDGHHLLSSDNRTIRQWDVASGNELNHVPAGVSSLAYAPDGMHFVTDYENNTVAIWDSATLTRTAVFSGHTAGVLRVLYSPDGRYVLSTSKDKTARIWDIASGRQVQIFRATTDVSTSAGKAETNFSTALAWSPDGKYALTGGNDGIVRLWDVQSGRLVRRFDTSLKGDDFGVLAYSSDGQTIATPGPQFTIVLWDATTGARLRELVGHTNTPNGAAFSPDGQTLFTSSQDNTARLWDVATGQTHQVLRRSMSGAVLAPDGRHAAVGGADGTVLLWDLAARADPPILGGATGRVWSVSFSTDDRTVLTSNDDAGTAQLWDATTGQPLPPVFLGPNNSTVNYAAFSPDGKDVLLADGRPDKAAHLFDRATGKELRAFPNTNGVLLQALFSPDGQDVLTAGFDSQYRARLWDSATARAVLTFTGHTSWLLSAAYAPDGRTVLTGSADGTARLWDTRTGQEIRRFTTDTGVVAVAYAPDGTRVLTGGDAGARLWDLQTGAAVGSFAQHNGNVNAAAFAPDGQSVLTGNDDGRAYLWDISGAPNAPNWGREVRRFPGHTAPVLAIAFSHDGRSVLTSSGDGTARIWRTAYQDTVRDLCARLTRDLTPEERTQYGITDPGPTCAPP
jgi:WD40 repeat protein/transcriptional regulator with XRE-family HTH domain